MKTPNMKGPVKRSLTIAGHRTSVSLEPLFWDLLNRKSQTEERSLGSVVVDIDNMRPPGVNLSSAIRCFLADELDRKVRGVP